MKGWRLAFVFLALVGVGYTFAVPDLAHFPNPAMARIVFYHVPSALICSVLIALAGWYGFKAMTRGSDRDISRLDATLEVGALFAVTTMLTGILFSKVQWNSWWHNDPRQMSFLIVCLLYLANLAVRSGFTDRALRAKVTGGFAAANLLPAMFLIFVFPRLPQIEQTSSHPSNTLVERQMDTWYGVGLVAHLLIIGLGAVIACIERYRLGMREIEYENNAATDQPSASGDRPRRPVVVPLDGSDEESKA